MIVYKDKNYQIRNDKPNENWTNEDCYIVDDNSELAEKIIALYPYYNFIIENDELIDVEDDAIGRETALIKMQKESRIIELKKNLSDTDYKAIKYAEGFISEEDYVEIKAQRQAWRDEINQLEVTENG